MRYLTLTLAFAFLAGCGLPEQEDSPQPSKAAPIPVTAVTIGETDWPSIYEATGTVRARMAGQISSRIMAYVREVRVKAGDRVRQGEMLVALDSKDLEARERTAEAARAQAQSAVAEADQAVESARASMDLAEATFRRMKQLHDKTSISHQEFDQATEHARVARAALDMAAARRKQIDARIAQADQEVGEAKIQTSYTVLAAPFAGIVTEKNVEPGNLAVPGAPLLTVENESSYRLEAAVEESKLSKIRIGQKVQVELDALARTLAGTVAEIVPAVDPGSRSFVVKIELPAIPQLRGGLFGRARFALGHRTTVAVPAAAVIQKGQMQWIFVTENGLAHSRLVSLGDRDKDRFEVLSGVAAGERVIAPVPWNLADGARVELRP